MIGNQYFGKLMTSHVQELKSFVLNLVELPGFLISCTV